MKQQIRHLKSSICITPVSARFVDRLPGFGIWTRLLQFWAEALGRPVNREHPGSRGEYRMLAIPPDEAIVQIQRVKHESRVHIDIETDNISAEVARLQGLGATIEGARRGFGWY